MALHAVSRRGFLLTTGALVAWANVPRIASAAPARDPRFVFINLRGALDGLAAVAPIGDPNYESARQGLTLAGGVPLDGLFALNPAMPTIAGLYRDKQAIVFHAVASPYRERSHFDGQDVLESGMPGVGKVDSGWMNRALAALPAGERHNGRGLSVGAGLPLVMRGKAQVVTWIPPGFQPASEDTRTRLLSLYQHRDQELATRLTDAIKLEASAGSMMDRNKQRGPQNFREAGLAAGRLLATPDGPRIGTMSFLGWDTHASEDPTKGTLSKLLASLDAAVDGLKTELGPAWNETVVLVATEFGRTVRMNGTDGTDHGTGTVAFLLGGAVKGGRVVADWPGLAEAQLYEKRDLKPTIDIRSVAKGVLRDHLGIGDDQLTRAIFPSSGGVKSLDGLIV